MALAWPAESLPSSSSRCTGSGRVSSRRALATAGAGLAHPLGHLLLGETVFAHEHLVAVGLFNRVQILPLEVLNEAELHHLAVVGLDDDGGDFAQARQLGGPPAALPGDDLVVARREPADGEGLNDPVDADRVGQILKAFLVKPLSGAA